MQNKCETPSIREVAISIERLSCCRQCACYICEIFKVEKRASWPITTPKSSVIEDADATGDVAQVYDEWRAKSGRQLMPGILKCFSHRPDFLRDVLRFGDTVHFSEGHLEQADQGGHRELGFVAESLSILTGLACLLPAGSGSG